MTSAEGPRTRLFVVADAGLAARLEALLRRDPALHVVVLDPSALTTVDPGRDTAIVVAALPAAGAARVLETVRLWPRPPAIILLSPAPHEVWTTRLRRSGVRAVLRRDASADELMATVAATKAGLLVLHPDVLARAPTARPLPSGESTTLTPRELQILEMMAEGMSNRAIAGRLKISRHTVKFHVAAILTKLSVRSRTEAVTVGVRQGLLSL